MTNCSNELVEQSLWSIHQLKSVKWKLLGKWQAVWMTLSNSANCRAVWYKSYSYDGFISFWLLISGALWLTVCSEVILLYATVFSLPVVFFSDGCHAPECVWTGPYGGPAGAQEKPALGFESSSCHWTFYNSGPASRLMNQFISTKRWEIE